MLLCLLKWAFSILKDEKRKGKSKSCQNIFKILFEHNKHNKLKYVVMCKCTIRFQWAIPEKIQTLGGRWGGGGWGQRISQGIEERACGSSKGQLKKKWNFQGCQRKTNVEFPKCVTQFYRIFRDESLFSPEFLRLKWQI